MFFPQSISLSLSFRSGDYFMATRRKRDCSTFAET
jgi:hypothetical protein